MPRRDKPRYKRAECSYSPGTIRRISPCRRLPYLPASWRSGFGGGRFEHLKVFAGFVPRDFPRQGIIRRTGTGCRFEFRRCGDRHRYFTTVRRVGNRVVFGTGYEQRCTHCDSQNGFEKSFHSRRMCLLVFSVIGVINAAACFAGSAIVQDSAVGKTFLDRDAEDLNRRSGVRSSPPP